MLRSPAAGGGGGGHPGRATLAGVGAGGFADLGVGREGKAEDGMGVWEGWGKYRAREFMGTAFFRWVWCGGAAGIVALAWQGRNRRPAAEKETVWVRALLGRPRTSRSLTGLYLFFFWTKKIVDGFRALVELTLWNIFLSSSQDFFWRNVLCRKQKKKLSFKGDLIALFKCMADAILL